MMLVCKNKLCIGGKNETKLKNMHVYDCVMIVACNKKIGYIEMDSNLDRLIRRQTR